MIEHYVGVDPGDKWVGWASLTRVHQLYTANMGVISRKGVGMYDDVEFIKRLRPTHLIVESFQQRPVGHNSFGRGLTLRFIGALQYMAEDTNLTWWEVAPGDAQQELNLLHIGKYVDKWLISCPEPRDANWRHAYSAWRVLAKALMMMGSPVLSDLARPKKVPAMAFERQRKAYSYLTAPTATWIR